MTRIILAARNSQTSTMSLVAAYASDSDNDEPQVQGSASRMGLPPPKTSSSRRQHVIHVDAHLPDAKEEAAPKKTAAKLADPAAPHSLLSMLPAPSAEPKERKKNATFDHSVSDDMKLTIDTQSAPASDNEGFRAMLGLKPRERMAPRAAPETDVVPTKAELLARAEKAAEERDTSLASATSAAPAISAAPEVRSRSPTPEQVDPTVYEGWHQDPDGSWVPVTPEAHRIYAQWLAENAPPPLEEQDIGTQRQFARHETVALLDADAEMHAHWDSKPKAAPAPRVEKPNMLAQVSERLQSDRLTNVRARSRGQLTSLIVQAQEKRQMLEDRWAHGRQKMRENKKRYGF